MTAFLLVLFLVVAARLFYFQVIQGEEFRQQADAQHNIYQKLLPSRGEIKLVDQTSAEAIPIAVNSKSYLVYGVPHDIINPDLTAASLATVLQMDKNDILSKISDKNKKYVPIKKQLTDTEQEQIKNLALPGIYFDSEDTRVYPENNLLSQVIGFVGYRGQSTQKVGLYGLERYFEKDLAGMPGTLEAEKDTNGAWIYGTKLNEKAAEDGVNLILTVDKTIQFQAQNVLAETVTKNGADGGTIIVINPKTGAILAMASYPDFDPNQFSKVTNQSAFNNMAVTGNYEPGSVFKALTMAAAIDEGKVTPDTTYTDTGDIAVGRFHIHNSDNKAHGVTTMTQVLDWSYNTGAVFAEQQLGNQDFYNYIKKFGFGQPTGIELPETKGDLSSLKGNIQTNYFTASFGQGITVTPIQMIQSYIPFANGGKMMKPYIVQTKIYADGRTENTQPQVVSQVFSEKTASILDAMLVDVVENGYGKKAGVPGYYIGGKTGTAQVAGPNGKYLENDNIGSFIGFAPVEDPKFVMLVRIDHPRDASFAETTAVPAWGQLAQFILNYYHIAPTRQIPGK